MMISIHRLVGLFAYACPRYSLLVPCLAFVCFVTPSVVFASSNGSQREAKVHNTGQLVEALRRANNSGGNTKILLEDGYYRLDRGLVINAPNISLIGISGDRDSVVIQGDAMQADAKVTNVITVNADNFVLDGITLQYARYHLIQVRGEKNVDGATLRNCVLRDSYQQMLKVSINPKNTAISGDNGHVENCLFEYTADVGPQHYIGGIDAHGSSGWVVRGNTFRNIISPSRSVAEYAVHFWNDSADNIVENNWIVNCDRGIGFGMGKRGNSAGIIRNNMIYHDENRGKFADVGIAIHTSPDTQIYNNTIFQLHSYANAIEYRFEETRNVIIANNLTNRRIHSVQAASAEMSGNNVHADWDDFVAPEDGDLHIQDSAEDIIDQALPLKELRSDFDGDARPQGRAADIGADELNSPRVQTDENQGHERSDTYDD